MCGVFSSDYLTKVWYNLRRILFTELEIRENPESDSIHEILTVILA